MGTEIERKFLVRGDGWKQLAPGVPYRQGYLNSDKERTVRVRLAGGKGFLTVKGPNRGAVRTEFEYPIPPEEAEAMLAELAERPIIEKIRYRIPFAGLLWEVDEFLGSLQGLVTAEVELEREDQPVELPDWIKVEVTGDPRYYNSNLHKGA